MIGLPKGEGFWNENCWDPYHTKNRDLNSFHFRNLILIFLWGFHLNSFYFRNLLPIFCRVFISTVCISEAFPLFFCAVWISTVFISENRKKVSEMKTVEIHTTKKIGIRFLKWKLLRSKTPPKNRDKVSEIKTVEIHTHQKNRDKVSEIKTVEIHTHQKNRDKVSEIKTVEIQTQKKIGIRFLESKLLRLRYGQGWSRKGFLNSKKNPPKKIQNFLGQEFLKKNQKVAKMQLCNFATFVAFYLF